MNINTITAEDLRRMPDKEGLILQGCGGDLTEWVDGIKKLSSVPILMDLGLISSSNTAICVKSMEKSIPNIIPFPKVSSSYIVCPDYNNLNNFLPASLQSS